MINSPLKIKHSPEVMLRHYTGGFLMQSFEPQLVSFVSCQSYCKYKFAGDGTCYFFFISNQQIA